MAKSLKIEILVVNDLLKVTYQLVITKDKRDPLAFQQQLNHEIKGVLRTEILELNLHFSDQVDTINDSQYSKLVHSLNSENLAYQRCDS